MLRYCAAPFRRAVSEVAEQACPAPQNLGSRSVGGGELDQIVRAIREPRSEQVLQLELPVPDRVPSMKIRALQAYSDPAMDLAAGRLPSGLHSINAARPSTLDEAGV